MHRAVQAARSGNIKPEVMNNVAKYVPSAVMPFINHQEEKWASELRRITVLFVNLGLKEGDLRSGTAADDLVQSVLHSVQVSVYQYEGSLNKFLMDDKGSTLIAVFGLPPLGLSLVFFLYQLRLTFFWILCAVLIQHTRMTAFEESMRRT